MYVETVPNRNSPPALLLRESYRERGKVKKRTLLNLSDWPRERIAGFTALLKGGTVIPSDQSPGQGRLRERVAVHVEADHGGRGGGVGAELVGVESINGEMVMARLALRRRGRRSPSG